MKFLHKMFYGKNESTYTLYLSYQWYFVLCIQIKLWLIISKLIIMDKRNKDEINIKAKRMLDAKE